MEGGLAVTLLLWRRLVVKGIVAQKVVGRRSRGQSRPVGGGPAGGGGGDSGRCPFLSSTSFESLSRPRKKWQKKRNEKKKDRKIL